MRTSPVMLWLVLGAGSSCGGGDSADTLGAAPCTPGEQRGCACSGGAPDGAQICASTGDQFGPCMGCEGVETEGPQTSSGDTTNGASISSSNGETTASSDDGDASSTEPDSADSTDDGSGPCAGHCSNGIQDCEEPFTDCGADCPDTAEYTFCDCLIDTPRNGSEVCDDTGFVVPGDAPPNVLVCLEATGGQIYIATNTSVDPNDGVQRCSGWELMGQNAWDYLDYIVPALTCDAVQKTQPFDITGYTGETLWFGAHNHPNGGGSGTTACIAIAK